MTPWQARRYNYEATHHDAVTGTAVPNVVTTMYDDDLLNATLLAQSLMAGAASSPASACCGPSYGTQMRSFL